MQLKCDIPSPGSDISEDKQWPIMVNAVNITSNNGTPYDHTVRG